MGFLTRLLIPRPVRRAAHPVRTAKRAVRRAVVPKPIRQVTYGASQLRNPIRAAGYHGIERPLTTALRGGARKRSRTPAPVYTHGDCPVKHRSIETAQRCTHDAKANLETRSRTPASPAASPKVGATRGEEPRTPSSRESTGAATAPVRGFDVTGPLSNLAVDLVCHWATPELWARIKDSPTSRRGFAEAFVRASRVETLPLPTRRPETDAEVRAMAREMGSLVARSGWQMINT